MTIKRVAPSIIALFVAVSVAWAAASYPTSVKVFTTKAQNETIQPAHMNDVQDEIVAVEQGLLNGFQHDLKPDTDGGRALGTSALRFKNLRLFLGTLTDQLAAIDIAGTWNDAADTFTAIKVNITDTASAAASLLIDLQVGGVSKFRVDKAGAIGPASGQMHTIPAVTSDTVTLLAATQTLTNKTLTSPVIAGDAPATPAANGLFKDNVPKAWASISYSAGVPTLDDDFNVTSITDNGVGDITITWDRDFASVNHVVVCMAVGARMFTNASSRAVGTVVVQIWDEGAGAKADPTALMCTAYGDQ